MTILPHRKKSFKKSFESWKEYTQPSPTDIRHFHTGYNMGYTDRYRYEQELISSFFGDEFKGMSLKAVLKCLNGDRI